MSRKQTNGFESGLRSMDTKHKTKTVLRCKVAIVGTYIFVSYVVLYIYIQIYIYSCNGLLKYAASGDACVGKTALTQVYDSGGSTFPKNYLMTTGVELCVKTVRSNRDDITYNTDI